MTEKLKTFLDQEDEFEALVPKGALSSKPDIGIEDEFEALVPLSPQDKIDKPEQDEFEALVPEDPFSPQGDILAASDLGEKVDALKVQEEILEEAAPKFSALQRGLDIVSRPGRATTGILKSALDPEDKNLFDEAKESLSPTSIFNTIVRGRPQKEETITTMSDIFKQHDVGKGFGVTLPETMSLGSMIDNLTFKSTRDLVSEISEKGWDKGLMSHAEKETEKLDQTFELTGRDLLAFAGDVAIDPLTYVTFGFSGVGKKIGTEALSSAGMKAFRKTAKKRSADIAEELVEKGVTKEQFAKQVSDKIGETVKHEQALIEAGKLSTERSFAKGIKAADPEFSKYIDKGGIKFAGKTIVPGKQIERAANITANLPGVKHFLNSKAVVKGRNTLGQMFYRDFGLDEKSGELIQEFYNRVGHLEDKTIKDVVGVFTDEATGKVTQIPERQLMFHKLAKAEDDSKELILDLVAGKETGLAQAKNATDLARPIINRMKEINKGLAAANKDHLMGAIKGLGKGRIDKLKNAGVHNVDDLAMLTPKELSKILELKSLSVAKRIGHPTAENIVLQARRALDEGKALDSVSNVFRDIIGIGPKRKEFLENANIASIRQLSELTPEQLIAALDKSARGLGIKRLSNNKELIRIIFEQAKDMSGKVAKEIPLLTKRKELLRDQLDEVLRFIDNPDLEISKIGDLKDLLDDYKSKISDIQINPKEFDDILEKRIKELPEHLQGQAKNLSKILKNNEQLDMRAGLLNKMIPNYFPRKYKFLEEASTLGRGGAGDVVKSLGKHIKHRKIGTLEEAIKLSKGGKLQLVEDAAVPVAERLLRGMKAREGNKLVEGLFDIYAGGSREAAEKFARAKTLKDKINLLPDPLKVRLDGMLGSGASGNPFLASVARNFDKATNIYKGALTSWFPAFHARNAMGNKFLMFLGNGVDAINPINIHHGLALKTGKNGFITDLFGRRHSYDKLREEASKYGVTRGYFGGDLVETIPQKLDKNLGTRLKQAKSIGRNIGETIEQTDRLTLFASYVKGGLDFESAGKQVNKFLFDYNNLSWFEQKVMKRIFPFYTFKRKSMELFAEQLVKQPGKFSSITDFQNFLSSHDITQEELAKLPHYMKNRIQIKVGPNEWLNGIEFGFEDAATTINDPKDLMSQTNPLAKLVIEQGGEYDFFRRQKFSEQIGKEIKDFPPQLLEFGPLKELVGAKKIKKPIYDENGNKTDEMRDAWVMTNPSGMNLLRGLPTTRFQSVAGKATRPDVSMEQFLSKALTGIDTKEIDPGLQRYFEKQRVKEILKKKYVGDQPLLKEFTIENIPKDQRQYVPKEIQELFQKKSKKKKKEKEKAVETLFNIIK